MDTAERQASITRTAVLDRLAYWSEAQFGHVTRAQALESGINDVHLTRAARSGDLQRVCHGVYRLRGTPEFSWSELYAHWLAFGNADPGYAGPEFVVSGLSAAGLYEIGNLPPEEMRFTVSRLVRTNRPGVEIVVDEVFPEQKGIVAGMPVTRPPRLVADLVMEGYDLDHIGQIAADAVFKGLCLEDEIAAGLNGIARRHGFKTGKQFAGHILHLAQLS